MSFKYKSVQIKKVADFKDSDKFNFLITVFSIFDTLFIRYSVLFLKFYFRVLYRKLKKNFRNKYFFAKKY